MKKILQSVFIMVTVLMILTPAFTMNVRKNQVSSMDNRQLNEFPEFAAGGGSGLLWKIICQTGLDFGNT